MSATLNDLPDATWVAQLIEVALTEDFGDAVRGLDVTSQATVSVDKQFTAEVVARDRGVLAGGFLIPQVLQAVSRRFELPQVEVELKLGEGSELTPGARIATLRGNARVILSAERTFLNLISRASGVASVTNKWAQALSGSKTLVLDTRKTTPGLRALEKYAVRTGGGTNKRMGLYDVAMIKDNHIVAAGSLSNAVKLVREQFPQVTIQVEADHLDQVKEALALGVKFLLLDNLDDATLREVVTWVRAQDTPQGYVELEATGRMTLERATSVGATGVDFVSVGALTHSAPIIDIGLDFSPLT